MAHHIDYNDASNETCPSLMREMKYYSIASASQNKSIDYNESDHDEYVSVASAADRGEAPEWFAPIKSLLDNTDTRRILYLILLSIWLLPLSVQTFDVVFATSALESNSFCVNLRSCEISFIGFIMITISTWLQFYVLFKQSDTYHSRYKHITYCSYFIQLLGSLLIAAVVS